MIFNSLHKVCGIFAYPDKQQATNVVVLIFIERIAAHIIVCSLAGGGKNTTFVSPQKTLFSYPATVDNFKPYLYMSDTIKPAKRSFFLFTTNVGPYWAHT
jgi:hypothetical protein